MRLAPLFVLLVSCGSEEVAPDGIWKVTLSNQDVECQEVERHTSLSTDELCGSDCSGEVPSINQTLRYEVFFDGDNAEIKVDGQTFATGVLEGCALSYESPVWLEERSDGDIQWSVVGHETEVQAKVDCGLPKGVDWIGYEEIQILESEDDSLEAGCSYRVAAVGEYVDQ